VVVPVVDNVPAASRTVVNPTVVSIGIPVVVIKVITRRRDVIPLIQSPILAFAPRS
jgi:hypothetical protein